MLLPVAFGVCFSPLKFRSIRYEQSDLEIEQYQILFPTTPCNKRSFWNAKDITDTRKTYNFVRAMMLANIQFLVLLVLRVSDLTLMTIVN